MRTVFETALWLLGPGVPIGLELRVMLRHAPADVVPEDAADAAFRAERIADARLQPFNGGAR